ncbi:hypothetical protein ACHAXR_003895, partial [Thalassiosira sp. AJA248-18]
MKFYSSVVSAISAIAASSAITSVTAFGVHPNIATPRSTFSGATTTSLYSLEDEDLESKLRKTKARNIRAKAAPAPQHQSQTPSRRRQRIPRMSDCQTLEEATKATYEHLHILSPRDMAAFWTVVPKLLQKGDRRHPPNKQEKKGGRNEHEQQMLHQFDTILAHTLEAINTFGYRDLAQTTLGFAKIVKRVQGKRLRRNSPQRILQFVFIGKSVEYKQSIFGCLAKASMPVLSEFEPRELSNVIYAFGLAEYNSKFEDGSTLFGVLARDHIARLDNLDKFKPQELSNIIWAYATANGSHPEIFRK